MGSLFNNSYNWDQYQNDNAPFKKGPLSSSGSGRTGGIQPSGQQQQQGEVFEDNLCVQMKKKELGISASEYDMYYNSQDGRHSPQIERLVREILAQEISDMAAQLAISMDPGQWSVDDTCAWLRHYASVYKIPGNITEFLTADGKTLCSYTDQDFIVRIGCEKAGNQIAAQLALWKKTGRSMNGGAPINFQRHQQYINPKLEAAEQCRSQSAKFGLDINTGWAPAPPPQVFSPQQELLSPNPYTNNTNNMEQNSMRSQEFTQMARPSFQQFTPPNQVPAYLTNEARYLPKPQIPLNRFRSMREACQDNGFLSYENYQKFTNLTPPPTMLSLFGNMGSNGGGGTPSSSSSSAKGSLQIPPQTPTGFNEGYEPPTETQPPRMPQEEADPDMKTPVLTDLDEEEPIDPTYVDLNIENLKQEVDPEIQDHPHSTDPPIKNPPSEKPPKKKSTKHPIHLWEFLKQLLHDGKDCIRWIDEEKGVFKIYNSQQVAKYWGERKNRPAMNYDKLSRSIRQYYKKGIIKKTTQGKRLVYQFCEAYL